MKLLYITNGITGAGGLERVLSVKATSLANDFGYDVHILSLNEIGKEPFHEFSPKIKFHSISVGGNVAKYIRSYVSGVRAMVKSIQPDIISVCDDGLKGLFIPKFLGSKIPIIYERHASAVFNESKLIHFLMQKLAPGFDRFVVLTKSNLKDWNGTNLMVIPNPLSLTGATQPAFTNKKVIAVGSHSYNKGTDLLLEIWDSVQSKFQDWSLNIYGKSTPDNFYEKMAEKKGLKNILFFSPIKDIKNEYLSSSIFVLSSRSEGFGMVLIEAMACGLPVISFDCPHGPGDIIADGKNGFLIENGNIERFSEKLSLLMEDLSLRQTMGKLGKQNISRYCIKEVMKQWEKLFVELTKY